MPSRNTSLVPQRGVSLRPLGTLGVGGPARWFARVERAEDLGAVHDWVEEHGVPLFVLGGGSNVVVADEGFAGLVLQMGVMGVRLNEASGEAVVVAGAGEAWDPLVERLVERGFGGVECLSGIPGTVGGTPIQNVGAYGQEVSGVIDRVGVFDRTDASLTDLPARDCAFAYRTSRFKEGDPGRFIVHAVTYRLQPAPPTVTYPDVAVELDRRGLSSPRLADVREAVLAIRRRKGMVVDASDPDTRSVGSFFMNPVVDAAEADRVSTIAGERAPTFGVDGGRVKIPAAWLIERGGFHKGHAEGAVGLSKRHTLAVVNRGGATARDVLRFAVRIKRAVIDWCGVWLRPEPVFVGLDGDDDVAFLLKARG